MDVSFRYKLSKAITNIRKWHDLPDSDEELSSQIESIAALAEAFGRSITLVRRARRDDPDSYDYNCYMWALGLLDRPWLKALAGGSDDFYPRADFVFHLVHSCLEEVASWQVHMDDLVVYFKDGKTVHAGRWDGGFVVSKWGLYSHLWKHGAFELPIEYGDEIHFYHRPPRSLIKAAFEKWRRHKRKAARAAPPSDPQVPFFGRP